MNCILNGYSIPIQPKVSFQRFAEVKINDEHYTESKKNLPRGQ